MGNKVHNNLTYLKEEAQSIRYQANIEENIVDVGPTKALINFAWFDSLNSIVWNHEVCSRLPKIWENQENGWKLK